MDMSNWRPRQGADGAVGDSSMESVDWRDQLQAASRERIVNKIMDTLKMHLPFSKELKEIAVRFEEKIYTAATSQSDYLRKISLKMLTMETRSQNPMPDAMQSNSTANSSNPSDTGSQIIPQVMTQGLLPNLVPSNLSQHMLQYNMRIQQQNQQSSATLLPTQVQQFQRDLQQRLLTSGGFQQQNAINLVPSNHSQHMLQYNMRIQQQNQLSSATLLPTQVQQVQRDLQQRLLTSGGFQQQNAIDQQIRLFQQQRPMPKVSSTLLDSTGQTVNPTGGDWQEEVYQKIKAMKDLYLLDLNNMHQKISGKLQQHDSLPQQLKNEQLEKLKAFKNMLERFIEFLRIPKYDISPSSKDKLATYEKQIVNVINRRKPMPTQQPPQALPPPHVHSGQQSQQTRSQSTQVQSLENQMNIQGSMAAMQQNNMGKEGDQLEVPSSPGDQPFGYSYPLE